MYCPSVGEKILSVVEEHAGVFIVLVGLVILDAVEGATVEVYPALPTVWVAGEVPRSIKLETDLGEARSAGRKVLMIQSFLSALGCRRARWPGSSPHQGAAQTCTPRKAARARFFSALERSRSSGPGMYPIP